MRRVNATGGTVDLAMGIIDGTHVLHLLIFQDFHFIFAVLLFFQPNPPTKIGMRFSCLYIHEAVWKFFFVCLWYETGSDGADEGQHGEDAIHQGQVTLSLHKIISKVGTRKVSSMIHSARPTVSPVVNIVFAWKLFCFEKRGRTDDMCKNNDHYRPWLWVGLVDQHREISKKMHLVYFKIYLIF